ncbi:MAG: bifunctional DNA-formamidopyrimidine glycosylase/DNA-(apurinic or apyrimidinic site) lyase [Alphaproteobacteria bacterium]
MPELPEVETVRRGLAPRVLERRIERVEVRRPDLRIPLPPDLAARLEGRRITRLTRRAKYIRAHLDDGGVLIIHLGMSGRLVVRDAIPNTVEPHEHIRLRFEGGTTVNYADHRRFGLMTLTSEAELESHPLFAHLGPEPLDEAFTGAVLEARLAGKLTPMKAALLDQGVVAGLGNIYVCEALYYAGLSPRRLARTVKAERAERLVEAIKAVLGRAIEAGGSSLRDYVQASGELGYFQTAFAVYDREGEKCPSCDCRGAVRRIVQSNRSTFYCAKRQR